MYSLGIDIGYSSVKYALIDGGNAVVFDSYEMHKGKIKETMARVLQLLISKYAPEDIKWAAVTGSGAPLISEPLGLAHVNEVQAVLEGSLLLDDTVGSIMEIGGQKAKFITGIGCRGNGNVQVAMNSGCSAGTGSFLEEQASRLKIAIEDYAVCAEKASSVPRIAGRCSVFAKTDITHHQQEGVSVEDILAGLAHALVKNYRGTVVRSLPIETPVMFAGGVGFNRAIVDAVKEVFRLSDDELVVRNDCGCHAAVGTALYARQNGMTFDVSLLPEYLEKTRDVHIMPEETVDLPRLAAFGVGDSVGKHVCTAGRHGNGVPVYLGIDVGSTSTNLVLVDSENTILAHKYLRTKGEPVKAVEAGLNELDHEWGGMLNVAGVGVTGSGRYMIGRHVGADCIRDEITAQAAAAVMLDEQVDTIFEIGGQDSKFIRLENGVVSDFQMNKVCAAGTGSFIEEQAVKFNIPIDEFGGLALESESPLNLGERCTVFIETSIAAHLAQGADLKDIASGLCYSIARNYLNRVVGQKPIGDRIAFQGGVAYNQGVINAFRALTGKKIVVPPFFSVSGAFGAALLAAKEMEGGKSAFHGFGAGKCATPPKTHVPQEAAVSANEAFNTSIEKLFFHDYTGELDPSKKTVGIPRALFTYGMFSMFNAFFRTLGFNVLMSDPTSEETIRLGQEFSLDETCYPVKLINGHVAELVGKNVDYVFFPDLFNVDHPGSHTRQNYGCAYMQLAFKIVRQAMELDKKGIELLAPTIAFSLGKEFMMKGFFGLGERLGRAREQTARALEAGMKAFHDFEGRIGENAKKVMDDIRPDEKVFVLVSKTYGVADPVLNLGIPGRLMEMGYKVVSFFDLPEDDIAGDHPNMFWPFGQHILEPAKLIRRHPNMYAILLTHHCCGPDSVLSHFFREIMDGKPYLNIEVDEHSSAVGVITRVEAFVNSLNNVPVVTADAVEEYAAATPSRNVEITTGLNDLKRGRELCIPNVYPYAQLFGEILRQRGYNAVVLPETDDTSVALGRKHTMTNEYVSLAAMLGDGLRRMGKSDRNDGSPCAFLIPQNEGAEVHGQYGRMLRTVFDREGFTSAGIVSPFVEDAVNSSRENMRAIIWGLLAGDLVRLAPPERRGLYLKGLLELAATGCHDIEVLRATALRIRKDVKNRRYDKRVFALGEMFVLYNDFLNDGYLKDIEEKGHRVLYAPLSECLWLMWSDYAEQNADGLSPEAPANIAELKQSLAVIGEALGDESPFEKDPNVLKALANDTVGYFAGSDGRYREAKILAERPQADGVIAVSSTYENTGIALGILHRGLECDKPLLNLTFDGNKNENDASKIESFLYYL